MTRIAERATMKIEFLVTPTAYARIGAEARKAGRQLPLFARLLFEAAYAVRVGKVDEPALAAAITAAIGSDDRAGLAVHAALSAAQARTAELERQLEMVTASLTDQEREAGDLRERIARLSQPVLAEQRSTPSPSAAPRDMVDRGRDEAPATDEEPLTPAFVRSCVGFKAVGNNASEIARLMRCDVAAVHRALSSGGGKPGSGRSRSALKNG